MGYTYEKDRKSFYDKTGRQGFGTTFGLSACVSAMKVDDQRNLALYVNKVNQFLIEQSIMLHRLEILSHCKMANDKCCE